MRHGITITESATNQMLRFLNTSREDAVREPPAWVEWDTASDSESSESSVEAEAEAESSGSSDSGDDDEYRPFLHLPPNPDGKRCRCGSTTHMTVNSHACPLNPRNIVANATTVRDDDAAGNGDDDVAESDDADATGSDDDDATGNDDDDVAGSDDDGVAESDDDDDDDDAAGSHGDDDSGDDPPDITATTRPVCRRRRLGLPTRRRRQIAPNNLDAPPSRRTRIENDASESEVQIGVGTNVQSPGTRWKLPATTIFKGKVVKIRIFRGALRYEVKWEQDGVVEYLRKEHILPLLC